MREVISIHIGQAGVQIGNACCKLTRYHPSSAVCSYENTGELYTLEHGLSVERDSLLLLQLANTSSSRPMVALTKGPLRRAMADSPHFSLRLAQANSCRARYMST